MRLNYREIATTPELELGGIVEILQAEIIDTLSTPGKGEGKAVERPRFNLF